jgi:phosphoglycerate dehydrogenase-like enzyme
VGGAVIPDALTILVVADVSDHHLGQIRAASPGARIEKTLDRARLLDLAPEADVMVGWNVPREVVQRATGLRWIHSTAAGVDQLLYPEVIERGILLTGSSGIHATSISEHVLALALAHSRRLPQAIRHQVARRWDRSSTIGWELAGQTMGILGLGAIGQALAAKAAALGMRVIGTKRTPGTLPGVERVLGPDGLDEVLSASDVLVIILPLTAETHGVIGARELALMKPTAFLINVARGAIVQEHALISALSGGALAGAGLDVFEREPLPQDSPLFGMEQVIMTPHVSGAVPGYYDRVIPLFCENLRRYHAGEPLLNVVDLTRGY